MKICRADIARKLRGILQNEMPFLILLRRFLTDIAQTAQIAQSILKKGKYSYMIPLITKKLVYNIYKPLYYSLFAKRAVCAVSPKNGVSDTVEAVSFCTAFCSLVQFDEPICTGNCHIYGIETAICATCGWSDDYLPVSGEYLEEK